jgi:hypothetical protein
MRPNRSRSRRGLGELPPASLDRSIYPTVGGGLHFVIKPKERMNMNLEYAQGVEDTAGVYLKLWLRMVSQRTR